MCIRRDADGAILRKLSGHLAPSPKEYRKFLPAEFLRQLKRVSLCGNYGDPSVSFALLGLLEQLREVETVSVTMETNGGAHDAQWWTSLAHRLPKGSTVVFNIDGLHDTLPVYRKGVSYHKVLSNASAFIAAGGNAIWGFIPFAHNEHQVEQARELSKLYGFSAFEVRLTERFYRNDGTRLSEFTKAGTTLRPPVNPALRYERQESADEYRRLLRSCAVACQAQLSHRIYIDFAGNVFPCCFTAAILGEDCEDLGTTTIREKLAELAGTKDAPNLRVNTLRDIVEGPFFRWLADMLPIPALRPVVCSAVCGAGLFKVRQ
jgi:hypothetical protein